MSCQRNDLRPARKGIDTDENTVVRTSMLLAQLQRVDVHDVPRPHWNITDVSLGHGPTSRARRLTRSTGLHVLSARCRHTRKITGLARCLPRHLPASMRRTGVSSSDNLLLETPWNSRHDYPSFDWVLVLAKQNAILN